jgi:NAD(P)-dependent dehydrogenase (short-subunit alcohol dehydrogenase family)
MKDFRGKGVIVTGGASGIGFGIAHAFAMEGARIVLADIDETALDEAKAALAALGAEVVTARTDVSDPESVAAAAGAAQAAFGKIHVAVNNAGVAMHGMDLETVPLEDCHWAFGVNVFGILHGIKSFLPLIRSHGEGGHVVNTASIAGLRVWPGLRHGIYAATKHAALALTQSLEMELEGTNIGVSALCPGAVNTRLYRSASHRPDRFGGAFERPQDAFLREFMELGTPPERVGQYVLEGIRERRFFIMTDGGARPGLEEHFDRIREGFAWRAKS